MDNLGNPPPQPNDHPNTVRLRSAMAIISAGLGIIGLGIIFLGWVVIGLAVGLAGSIMGIIALVRINGKRTLGGKGLAVMGIVTGILMLAIVVPTHFKLQMRQLNLQIKSLAATRDQLQQKVAQQQNTINRLAVPDVALHEAQVKLSSDAVKQQRLVSQRDQLQSQVDSLKATVAARDKALSNANAQIQLVTKTCNTAITKANDEIQNYAKERNDLVAKYKNLADRMSNLTRQNEYSQQIERRYEEQLTAAQDEANKYRGLWVKVPDNVQNQILKAAQGQTKTTPSASISGKITQMVKQGGLTLVKINVGASHGVHKNMMFYVYRGDTFLAKLVVQTVDLKNSAGVLLLIQGTVQPGDDVIHTAQTTP